MAILAPAVVNLIDSDFSINLVENLEEEEHNTASEKVVKNLELIHTHLKAGFFYVTQVNNTNTSFYGVNYESLAHEIILPPPEHGNFS